MLVKNNVLEGVVDVNRTFFISVALFKKSLIGKFKI